MARILTLDEIERLAHAALARAGASDAQAAPVARSIRAAEAEGARNIGLGYLPTYCGHLRVRKVIGDATPVVGGARPGAVTVDAADGFAHAAYEAGEPALIAAARAQGVAAMSVTNSCANGVVGYFVDRLAREGLVALATTSGSALVAPWGGKRPFFCTNPFALGAPRTGAEPLVIDSSASATAWVNIKTAADEGRAIPLGWGLDVEGRPTTDPNAALAGTVAPAGGHKGFAVALMVEVLAAGLAGAHWSFEASSLGDDLGGPSRIGQNYLAFDPDAFAPDFAARLDVMLAAMTDDPGVRVPGERRHANRRRAEAEGVALDAATETSLARLLEG